MVVVVVGPSGGFDELPLKTQKTAEVLQESLFCHCFCRVGEMEIKINVIAGSFSENFSRKEFMVRLVDLYPTFVMRGSIQVKQ